MVNSKAIADALTRIRDRENAKHPHIVMSEELTRSDRELLVRTGWLREIIQGWYLLIKPDILPNDSTPWYAHFWDFLMVYLDHRFNQHYCLSAESSLDVLLEVSILPKQVVVIVSQGGGKARSLPFETSLLMYTDPKNIPEERIEKRGLQIMSLPFALCRVSATYFQKNPKDAEIALRSIRTASELSQIIIQYNLKAAAGRLIGAYHFLNDSSMADRLEKDLISVGMQVVPENPFQQEKPLLKTIRPVSPYVARIEALWQGTRESIIANFLPSPGIANDVEKYMKNVEEIYESDAYNSLSIEGYQVTPELIEKVKQNHWNPMQHSAGMEQRNALAARGYYEAFQSVKNTVRKIITLNKNSGKILEEDLQDWYQGLFSPSVHAGLISANQLLGYRKHPVYIRNSRHVPPSELAIVDLMECLFKMLQEEPEASVRSVLGHYIFVFIHPYMDGNGRMARFLMNAMLASGGYSWIVIPLARRAEYMSCLSIADLEHNLLPFTNFIVDLFKEYTFHDVVMKNAIKDIIEEAGYQSSDFEIKIWDLPGDGKNLTICYKKNRQCKKDFNVSYPPYEKPIFIDETAALFSNKYVVKKTFLI